MNKICKKCRIDQDINNFYAAKQGKLGRASRCKSCLKEEASKPEQIEMAKKRRDKYYSKNKEKQSERAKEKYRQNPEFYIKKAKLWSDNNKERHKENKQRLQLLEKIKTVFSTSVKEKIKEKIGSVKNFLTLKPQSNDISDEKKETMKELLPELLVGYSTGDSTGDSISKIKDEYR